MSIQRLFELSSDMLCVIDSEGRFKLVNPAFTSTLGWDQTQLIGSPLIDLIHPEDGQTLTAVCNNRVRCSDQSYKHLSWKTTAEHGDTYAIARDVTVQHADQEQLKRTNAWLASANKSMEEFVYIASHDLREPLTGIAGYADLVRKRYSDKLDDKGQHFLTSIVEQAKRLESKIEDLLQLSRAGRGKPNGLFPLGAAIEEARRALASSIRDSRAVVETIGTLPMVRGNRSEIAQIYQNLFSNSIKYKQPNTIPHIKVSARVIDNGWEMQTEDNGIGFDMAHADRIFGVFQRLYTIEQYPGTGIGLAIVKKIVDKHGGTVRATSESNKGSTFFFSLPMSEPQKMESP